MWVQVSGDVGPTGGSRSPGVPGRTEDVALCEIPLALRNGD
jgi:hypothetical protein